MAVSKSKAMYVGGQRQLVQPPVPLVLCGSPLPWVNRCGHLGHLLSIDGPMDHDCRRRRAEFIDNTVKIREMFSFAYPSEIIAAIDKHCCSFYGSSLYNLQSAAVDSLCAAWRMAIKLSLNVDRATHGYFITTVFAS